MAKVKKQSRAKRVQAWPRTSTRYKMDWTKEPYRVFQNKISVSMIRSFLTCREQCRISYIERWRTLWSSDAIAIGSAFHGILEIYIAGKKIRNLEDAVARYLREATKAMTPMQDKAKRQIGDVVRLVHIILKHYLAYWEKEDQKLNWVAKEEWFNIEVPITVPEWEKTFMVPLYGIWDGITEYKGQTKPNLFLFESKTMGRIDQNAIQDTLPVNLQTMLYAYAIKQTFGVYPRGLWFDVTRTPGMRQGVKETHSELLGRIDKDITKRPEHYFMRWNLVLLPSEIEAWFEKVLTPILQDMLRWYLGFFSKKDPECKLDDPFDNPHHYMNPEALIGKYGRCFEFNAILRNDYSQMVQIPPSSGRGQSSK